ncbi:MAG: alpha-ketoglutarate-dependent dioxygenase AlkB [Pyrinomonadaceae bacterium]
MKLLPIQCEAYYLADFLNGAEAEALFSEIVSGFDVADRRVRMFDGTEYVAKAGAYMFADPELTSFEALPEVWGQRAPWPDSLALVRDRVTVQTGVRFRVARCVYYKDGSEGVDFHRDLPAYGSTSAIASLSLGAEREFVFRSTSDTAELFSIRLYPGSLLFSGEGCQELYEHALPRDERCTEPRLNLTFRKYGWE